MKKFLILLMVLASALQASAQDPLEFKGSQGKMYFAWGYNRAFYNTSDIHFQGEGYDFTLHDVKAYDSPEAWDPKVYLNPTKLTIPQFNFRLGYFIKDRIAISGGWDHMKYRLAVPQVARISGSISPDRSEKWQGEYNNDYITLQPDFVRYEHTDGFNLVRLALEYYHPVWNSKNKKHSLNFMLGGGVSAAMPWTDTVMLGKRSRTQPHLAGFAFSGLSGLRFEFFNHFFAQWRAQYGLSYMGDVLIEDGTSARAKQRIVFYERALLAGVYFRIGKIAANN